MSANVNGQSRSDLLDAASYGRRNLLVYERLYVLVCSVLDPSWTRRPTDAMVFASATDKKQPKKLS